MPLAQPADCAVTYVVRSRYVGQYVASLAAVLRPAGACYLMCFSDRQPGTMGPRRITQDEITAAVSIAINLGAAGSFEK